MVFQWSITFDFEFEFFFQVLDDLSSYAMSRSSTYRKNLFFLWLVASGRKPGQPTTLVPHDVGFFMIAFFRHCATTIRTQEHVVLPVPSELNP